MNAAKDFQMIENRKVLLIKVYTYQKDLQNGRLAKTGFNWFLYGLNVENDRASASEEFILP